MIKGMLNDRFPIETQYNVLRWTIRILLVSALMEFLLLRIFMRMGIVLPRGGLADAIYNLLVFFFGIASFNLAFILSSVSLGLISFIMTQKAYLTSVISLIIFCVLLTGGMLISGPNPRISLIYYFLSSAILVTSILFSIQRKIAHTSFTLSVVAGFSGSYYYMVASSMGEFGFTLPFVLEIFSLGELIALIVPLIAFFTLKSEWDWRCAIIAFVLVPFFIIATRSPLLAPIATWSVYFTLHLPAPFYVVALWFYIYMIVDLFQQRSPIVFSFLFLLLAGRMLNTIYLNQLALLSVLVLIMPLYQGSS
ncbi:hypothetical protein CL673_02470 [Candidatus Bathyarchaeota archaeon]|nr:hypothetical protein [Candidatus Bathyarchaeota archaeon]